MMKSVGAGKNKGMMTQQFLKLFHFCLIELDQIASVTDHEIRSRTLGAACICGKRRSIAIDVGYMGASYIRKDSICQVLRSMVREKFRSFR